MSGRSVVDPLASGRPVFGIFAPDHPAAGAGSGEGAAAVDFVFYDLETAAWDMRAFADFVDAVRRAPNAEGESPAILLRIPPLAADRDGARGRIAEGLAAGADGLILPQVEDAGEVVLAVDAVLAAGRRVWPLDEGGDAIVVVQIESPAAVEAAREILAAPGVGAGLPGQKDLRASYVGDERAVQRAVDAVLAACGALGLPCGVTAGPRDVERRLDQGFRFVIATPPQAVTAGRIIQGAWTS